MNTAFTVEPLGSSHVRAGFSCGIAELDRYFMEFVSQDIKRRVSNCFVACDESGVVAGYYTFAATGIPFTDLPDDETKRLPRYQLLPAGLIGRLAVDHRYAKRGLGSSLIVDAVARSMRSEPAIFALVVDAKNQLAADFYQHLGFRPFVSRPMSLFLPISEAARRIASS